MKYFFIGLAIVLLPFALFARGGFHSSSLYQNAPELEVSTQTHSNTKFTRTLVQDKIIVEGNITALMLYD